MEKALELNKRAVKKFKRRKIIVSSVDHTWAIDIADMNAILDWNSHRYIFVIIDIFSRFVWAVPMKTKDAEESLKAFTSVTGNMYMPERIWCDQGGEFVNKIWNVFLKEHNIIRYHTYGEHKASIVERVTRTLKEMMYLQFTAKNNYNWDKTVLKNVVLKYNNRLHKSIGMTPVEARKDDNYQLVFDKMTEAKAKIKKPLFKVGDRVRISVTKLKFEKGHTFKWSTEVFNVSRVNLGHPNTYNVKDDKGEALRGSFYEQELQLSKV